MTVTVTDRAFVLSEPSGDDLRAVRASRVFFAHQSVGSNLLSGIGPVYAAANEVPPQIVETREPLPALDSFLAHAHVGRNCDPQSKLAEFADVVSDGFGDALDVAVLKFCYADVTANTDVAALFDAYWATIDRLRVRYPALRLVHATVPVTTDRSWKARTKALLGRDDHQGPADNLARERYNAMMRDRCGDIDTLVDIAAVEATIGQQPMVRHLKGQRYLVLNRALSADAGHLNSLGSEAAASEFIRVLALALR